MKQCTSHWDFSRRFTNREFDSGCQCSKGSSPDLAIVMTPHGSWTSPWRHSNFSVNKSFPLFSNTSFLTSWSQKAIIFLLGHSLLSNKLLCCRKKTLKRRTDHKDLYILDSNQLSPKSVLSVWFIMVRCPSTKKLVYVHTDFQAQRYSILPTFKKGRSDCWLVLKPSLISSAHGI